MERRPPGSRALVGAVALAITGALGGAPRGFAADRAAAPFELTIDTHRVLFTPASETALDDGRVTLDPARGLYAVRVDVRASEAAMPWKLCLRADAPAFASEGAGKPCHDLRWKFDHEGAGAYRPVEDRDTIVLERSAGGSAEIEIDLSIDMDWSTPPGVYGLGLVFSLVPE